MSVKIKDVDRGYNALVKRVFGKEKHSVAVGIFAKEGAQTYDDGLTVLQVAIWNEFGTDKIPERSFIRAYFDENQERLKKIFARLMSYYVIQGRGTKEQVLELLGQQIVGEIRKRISRGIPPPNAPSTIAKKGSSKPLIDTGQLRSSITYRVSKDGNQ